QAKGTPAVNLRASSLKNWADTCLGSVYPEVCQICGHEPASAHQGLVGDGCARKVRLVKPPFCARCVLPYEGDITLAFECANCRDLNLHLTAARSAALAGELLLDII